MWDDRTRHEIRDLPALLGWPLRSHSESDEKDGRKRGCLPAAYAFY